MLLMIAGLVVFLGLHSLPVSRPLHESARRAMGATAYRIVFSLASLAGLVMIVEGYKAWRLAGPPVFYQLPAFVSHISLLLMALAFVSLAATYLPSHIRRALRHPMLVAVKLWAFAHLLANGDAASVTLFGAFLAWAVVDRISVKRRERAGEIDPRAFAPRWWADAAAVGIGLAVYVLFVWKLHLWLIGVSPLTMPSAV